MDKISIIVPCYNEEKALPEFYRVTSDAVNGIEGAVCEFIFVDDGSSDHTSDILESFACADSRCRYISFSRNFGKEAAMYAGLQNASGDYCVFMDADLQHPPQLLKEMYHVLKTEGYDCCAGLREDRTGENKLRSILSRTFYKIIRKTCKLDMGDGKGDFRMMNRTMADSILELKEYNRYMKGIFSFVGFDTKWIPFHNVERTAGETKWSLPSLFRYAIDGILSFSSAPVTMAGTAGALLILAAIVTGIWALLSGNGLTGIPLLVCLILLLNGVQMFFISILGQYVSKDYMESKKRPIYIVKKKGGFTST
ncbi:glycosyltransferase family 2 protein [Mediterraneibacter glycyrrhizinilyticus]|uniref:glycosyltransferase family 2 protein n=1 Tax=Mediterraneibacter glycyrrhizinilyticus TaxID=342942 RepID=UPI0025AAC936|nr:glycosyltransferase family 2 protein [Mediterraneibacter glycyrrhizinilyticus]MDN0061622.1 glycosyltransferase family 2 protein [Mediterraneibacter glycyrrhizinilyticus]